MDGLVMGAATLAGCWLAAYVIAQAIAAVIGTVGPLAYSPNRERDDGVSIEPFPVLGLLASSTDIDLAAAVRRELARPTVPSTPILSRIEARALARIVELT